MAYNSNYGGGNAYETAIRQREQSYAQPQQRSYAAPTPQGFRGFTSGGIGVQLSSRLGTAPPAPQAPSVYTGRMQVNGMGTAGAGAPTTGREAMFGVSGTGRDNAWSQRVFGQGGGMGLAGGPADDLAEQVRGLTPEQQQRLADFHNSLYAGPDYKGRHEAAQLLDNQYARLMLRLAGQPEIDFSGSSAVADQFGNQRERMLNTLAARGVSGSGVEAGALANSYGNQARAQGQFYRDAMEQRRREELAQEIAFENWARGIEGQGLQRNWAEQDAPGFFDKLLGVAGGVAGSLIPGGGNPISAITGLLGGGDQPRPTYYGPTQYDPHDYRNYDERNTFGYGDQFGAGYPR